MPITRSQYRQKLRRLTTLVPNATLRRLYLDTPIYNQRGRVLRPRIAGNPVSLEVYNLVVDIQLYYQGLNRVPEVVQVGTNRRIGRRQNEPIPSRIRLWQPENPPSRDGRRIRRWQPPVPDAPGVNIRPFQEPDEPAAPPSPPPEPNERDIVLQAIQNSLSDPHLKELIRRQRDAYRGIRYDLLNNLDENFVPVVIVRDYLRFIRINIGSFTREHNDERRAEGSEARMELGLTMPGNRSRYTAVEFNVRFIINHPGDFYLSYINFIEGVKRLRNEEYPFKWEPMQLQFWLSDEGYDNNDGYFMPNMNFMRLKEFYELMAEELRIIDIHMASNLVMENSLEDLLNSHTQLMIEADVVSPFILTENEWGSDVQDGVSASNRNEPNPQSYNVLRFFQKLCLHQQVKIIFRCRLLPLIKPQNEERMLELVRGWAEREYRRSLVIINEARREENQRPLRARRITVNDPAVRSIIPQRMFNEANDNGMVGVGRFIFTQRAQPNFLDVQWGVL